MNNRYIVSHLVRVQFPYVKEIGFTRILLQFYRISLLVVLILVSSCAHTQPKGIEETVILPCSIPNDYTYCYIYVLREQECSPCSISALYQWEDIIRLIGRDDIYYLFIVEPNPEDNEETIQEALLRRPFHRTVFVDYQHTFLEKNRWLKNNAQIEGFLIEMDKNKVIAVGNPMKSFVFMASIQSLNKDSDTP